MTLQSLHAATNKPLKPILSTQITFPQRFFIKPERPIQNLILREITLQIYYQFLLIVQVTSRRKPKLMISDRFDRKKVRIMLKINLTPLRMSKIKARKKCLIKKAIITQRCLSFRNFKGSRIPMSQFSS